MMLAARIFLAHSGIDIGAVAAQGIPWRHR